MNQSRWHVTRYEDPNRFSDRTRAHLERDESANNLIIGITGRLCEDITAYDTEPPYMAVVEDETDDQALVAVALMTPPYSLIIHCAPDQADNVLPRLAADLEQSDWVVSGVNAPVELAEAFAAIWTERTGSSSRIEMQLRTYVLRQVDLPQYSPGRLRLAKPDEVDLVVDWVYEFMMEALDDTESFDRAHAQRNWANAIERGVVVLWENSGPVSMASTGRHTTHGINIGMVYTPPHQRGKGYASACVATLCQQQLDSGWAFCTLYTDLANPTSNAIYQRIGFEPICDFAHLKFE